jgi:hypothetical protein
VHVVGDGSGSRISRGIPGSSGFGVAGWGRHGDTRCRNGGGFLRRRSSRRRSTGGRGLRVCRRLRRRVWCPRIVCLTRLTALQAYPKVYVFIAKKRFCI